MDDFINGKRELPERRYEDKGRAKWSNTIQVSGADSRVEEAAGEKKAVAVLSARQGGEIDAVRGEGGVLVQWRDEEQAQAAEGGDGTPAPVNFEHSKCPCCVHHVSADRKAFDTKTLAAKTWCKICEKSWEAKLWLCKCGCPRHACNAHREAPSDMHGEKRRYEGEQKARKVVKSEVLTIEWPTRKAERGEEKVHQGTSVLVWRSVKQCALVLAAL